MGLLQEDRLTALTHLSELANAHYICHILVVGDVYPKHTPSCRKSFS
jgi:hypothetical protein